MGALLLPVLAAVVVLVLLAVLVHRWMSEHTRRAVDLAEPDTSTLDYVVPEGQDPAVLLGALVRDGFEASPDPAESHVLHISCPAGPDRDRARARACLEAASSTALDHGAPVERPVRFRDEAPA
jgi:hypothetical protein